MKFFVKSSVAEERLSICKQCDQLSELSICKQCGCIMPLKVKMGWVDCPLKKWNFSDDIDLDQPVPLPQENVNVVEEEIIIVP